MKNSAKLIQKFLTEAPILIDIATRQFNDLGVGFSEEEMKGYKY